MGISADAFLFYGFFFSLDRHDENTDAWLEKRLPEGIKFEVLDFDFGNDFFAYVEGRYYLAHADRRVRIDPDVLAVASGREIFRRLLSLRSNIYHCSEFRSWF